MTPIARLKAYGPCDLAVVTNTAELSFLYRIHSDLIGACLHLKWSRVAGVALEPDTMKPMGKDSYWNSSFATLALENDVSFYGERYAEKKNCQDYRREHK